MPGELGIGITDYILAPGSDAAKFSRAQMMAERDTFYQRLAAHARRAGAAPRLVVFVGKKQCAYRPTCRPAFMSVHPRPWQASGIPIAIAKWSEKPLGLSMLPHPFIFTLSRLRLPRLL